MAQRRAKYYVEMIRANPVQDTLLKVARMLFDECSEMMKVRTAKTDKEAVAILDAQDQKWQLVCRRLPEYKLRKNGFRMMVIATYPNLVPYLTHWKEAQTKGD